MMAEKHPASSKKIALTLKNHMCNSASNKFKTLQSNSVVRYHSKIPV